VKRGCGERARFSLEKDELLIKDPVIVGQTGTVSGV